MDNNNIVSFEEYRKKKTGNNYQEDALSAIFKKDLREQTDLLQWYMFHNIFNKHKLFVHSLFYQNHVQRSKNPNAGFVVCYSDEQITANTSAIINAVEWEKRKSLLINATDKTYRQLGEMLTGFPHRENYEVIKSFKEVLLTADKVIVIQGLSMMKTTLENKRRYAYGLIKVLDDAHFDGIIPKADLIFVDYARFLQDTWKNIGSYLNILT